MVGKSRLGGIRVGVLAALIVNFRFYTRMPLLTRRTWCSRRVGQSNLCQRTKPEERLPRLLKLFHLLRRSPVGVRHSFMLDGTFAPRRGVDVFDDGVSGSDWMSSVVSVIERTLTEIIH